MTQIAMNVTYRLTPPRRLIGRLIRNNSSFLVVFVTCTAVHGNAHTCTALPGLLFARCFSLAAVLLFLLRRVSLEAPPSDPKNQMLNSD